ncbi:hypothetical protein ACH5RR_033790 [Cinchona calisaya]|uniref:RNase H type-1 domain-containing protein n=1 Tax=Cinchona calisaya TaxID=153742 RepID=A0ABD2YCS9_9GENT
MIKVYWNCSPAGCLKLNVDGSLVSSSGLAGYGGLLQDSTGCLLFGFAYSFGQNTIMAAELSALVEGVKLCMSQGYMDLIIESDFLILCHLICSDTEFPCKLDGDSQGTSSSSSSPFYFDTCLP